MWSVNQIRLFTITLIFNQPGSESSLVSSTGIQALQHFLYVTVPVAVPLLLAVLGLGVLRVFREIPKHNHNTSEEYLAPVFPRSPMNVIPDELKISRHFSAQDNTAFSLKRRALPSSKACWNSFVVNHDFVQFACTEIQRRNFASPASVQEIFDKLHSFRDLRTPFSIRRESIITITFRPW